MLEEWKSALDKMGNIRVLFMNLSKAFYTINHDLLLAKLKAYGFYENTHNLRNFQIMLNSKMLLGHNILQNNSSLGERNTN